MCKLHTNHCLQITTNPWTSKKRIDQHRYTKNSKTNTKINLQSEIHKTHLLNTNCKNNNNTTEK